MTLRAIDGFDYFPTGQNEAARERLLGAAGWFLNTPSQSTLIAPDFTPGRFAFGECAGWTNYSNSSLQNMQMVTKTIGAPSATIYMGWAVYVGASNLMVSYVNLYDAVSNLPQLTFVFGPNGVVSVYRGYYPITLPFGPVLAGTHLASSSSGAFQTDQWFFFEVGAVIGTTGSYEVRINTGTILLDPAVNTKNTTVSGADSVSFGLAGNGLSPASNFYVDDLYVCDNAGSANNNFLGNVRVFTQATTGAGAVTDFSKFGSAATNWQTVQNKLMDDTQYVYDNVTGDLDLYQMAPIVTGPSVLGVQTRIGARQDDATQITLVSVLKSGATQVTGADHLINQTYTYYTDIFETDPNTGVGWTATNVNAIQSGPKKKV